MLQRKLLAATVLAVSAAASACTSSSNNYIGAEAQVRTERIYVCSGFNCHFKTRLDLGATDAGRFAQIMAAGVASAQAERAAIANSVKYYEKRAGQAIGVIDDGKSVFGASGELGQMDCIDESTNTRSLLLYLERRGLLIAPRRTVERFARLLHRRALSALDGGPARQGRQGMGGRQLVRADGGRARHPADGAMAEARRDGQQRPRIGPVQIEQTG